VTMNMKSRSPRNSRKPTTATRAKHPTTYNGCLMHELGMTRRRSRNRRRPQQNDQTATEVLLGGRHVLVSALAAAVWVQRVRLELKFEFEFEFEFPHFIACCGRNIAGFSCRLESASGLCLPTVLHTLTLTSSWLFLRGFVLCCAVPQNFAVRC
jgi:hypothetical protein